jgi:FkbH-like protein
MLPCETGAIDEAISCRLPLDSAEGVDSLQHRRVRRDDGWAAASLRGDAMKLLEALEILKRPISGPAATQEVCLECGFTPLHLKTFLAAHLRLFFPESRIEIRTGLYGDLAGNLERLQPSGGSVICAVVEWADLDPRLGIRSLGSWRSTGIPEIVESARRQSERLAHCVKRLAESVPVYASMPTLPLPPIFVTRGSQAHHQECELRQIVASLATSISACQRVKVASGQRLDEISPFGKRLDPRAEISSGFPYSLEHASRLADLIANLIRDLAPKKGLITDLDDTLWAGVLGEIGVEAVSWEISGSAHVHGLYQRFLESLASAGVLLAVASKNDSSLVEQALARKDILLSRDTLFPLEIDWGPKSASVGRILKQWNIGPDDVVFIDDSPMEVAEVHAAFPQMECVVFPKNDYHAMWEFLKHLRDRFGKGAVSSVDHIRSRTIRSGAAFRDSMQAPGISSEDFLRLAEATISFSLEPDVRDSRALELINKTNQFNLNGRRLSESEWLGVLRNPAAFLLTASYEDKYGPLGKITVVMGKTAGSKLYVDWWVMSCRAFSRRIEHQCLKHLFEKMGITEITFDYKPTPRNRPIQDFFTVLLGEPPAPGFSLPKVTFDAKIPALFHRVVEVANV